MFPSFTGSTRPRRQVNLSGRNSNPFAAIPGSRTSSTPQSAQHALAHAQQERILRQQERERPPAATQIQRVWRGHKERRGIQEECRQEWDRKEAWALEDILEEQVQSSLQAATAPAAYGSEEECLSSLRLLVQFAAPNNQGDIQRLCHFASRYLLSMPLRTSLPTEVWTHLLIRLSKITLGTLGTIRSLPLPSYAADGLLRLLHSLAITIPEQIATYAPEYFGTLAVLAASHRIKDVELLGATAVSFLQPITPRIDNVYEGFASEFLTTPELPTIFGGLEVFARGTKYNILINAIDKLLHSSANGGLLQSKSRESLLWLLSYFIYFRRWTFSEKSRAKDSPDAVYVKIISKLISFLADDIGNSIDTSPIGSLKDSDKSTSTKQSSKPFPAFVRNEILTLIDQENVSSLLANMDVTEAPRNAAVGSANEASALASYALTLLRAFPRRGDEIRMWLYRGSTSRQTQTAEGRKVLPAIKYFYQAASKTKIFETISKDPREAVSTLRPSKPQIPALASTSPTRAENRDQEWRVILLFLELYTFVLKVMDDEEFLSGTLESTPELSWTRQSALPLDQVKDLTFFLKNLAFSLYWNASEIAGMEPTEAKTSLAEYFGSSRPGQTGKIQTEAPSKFEDMSVAGVSGMTLPYMKGMVTGVLRMVYERE